MYHIKKDISHLTSQHVNKKQNTEQSIIKEESFYITTPIYYVNAAPHVGSLYSTLIADIIARYHKICGKKVYFATGLDEHGQKVAEAAEKANMSCQAFVDSLVGAFTSTWKEWGIEYDFFVRTTDKNHQKAVQEWIRNLIKKDLIYKAKYEGWYSVSSEAFLTEKDIEAVDATGAPLCPISNKPAIWLSQEAYFFRLSAFEKPLLTFYESHPDFISPKERIQEVISFAKEGLKDLCISRSKKALSWGIPFPDDNEHVVYVWADALNNYLTACGYLKNDKKDLFETFWPCNMHVLGKDIVRFHAVFWPAFLMASDLELPKKLLVHGWILVNDKKMSKSIGNIINPQELLAHYGLDRCRYYFARHLAVTQDSSFSHADLEEKTNAELSNAFGNLIQRTLSMAHTYQYHTLDGNYNWLESEINLQKSIVHTYQLFDHAMQEGLIHRAYTNTQELVNKVNAYLHEQEPWKLFKTNPERVKTILAATLHAIYSLSLLFSPLLPETMNKVFDLLGVSFPEKDLVYLIQKNLFLWNLSFDLKKPINLFPRYEIIKNEEPASMPVTKKSAEESTSSTITIEELSKCHIRVGTIIAAETISGADKLYKLTVDFGTHGTRTICAGIRNYYKEDEIIGIKTLFAHNLTPRNLKGIESHGMTLMTKNNALKPLFIKIDASVENGTLAQ